MSTNAIPYDDPDLAVGGDYVKWQMVGQSVIGTITGFRKQMRTKADGTPYANGVYMLREDDGTEINLEVGQIFLKGLFAEQRPGIGDKVRITYTEDERLPGKPSPMKKFSLEVKKADPVQAHLEEKLGATVISETKPPF